MFPIFLVLNPDISSQFNTLTIIRSSFEDDTNTVVIGKTWQKRNFFIPLSLLHITCDGIRVLFQFFNRVWKKAADKQFQTKNSLNLVLRLLCIYLGTTFPRFEERSLLEVWVLSHFISLSLQFSLLASPFHILTITCHTYYILVILIYYHITCIHHYLITYVFNLTSWLLLLVVHKEILDYNYVDIVCIDVSRMCFNYN